MGWQQLLRWNSSYGCESEWGRLLLYSLSLLPQSGKWLVFSKDIGGATRSLRTSFRLVRYPGYFSICIPYWFPTAWRRTCAVVATKVVNRFSLRTLLIATTVVAVVLGASYGWHVDEIQKATNCVLIAAFSRVFY